MKNPLLIFFTNPNEFFNEVDYTEYQFTINWEKKFELAIWTGKGWQYSDCNSHALTIPKNILLVRDDTENEYKIAASIAASAKSSGYDGFVLIYHSLPSPEIVDYYKNILGINFVFRSQHTPDPDSRYYQLSNYLQKIDISGLPSTISHSDFIFKIVNGSLPFIGILQNLAITLRNILDAESRGLQIHVKDILVNICESNSSEIKVEVSDNEGYTLFEYYLNWEGLPQFKEWVIDDNCSLVLLEEKVHNLLKTELTKDKSL